MRCNQKEKIMQSNLFWIIALLEHQKHYVYTLVLSLSRIFSEVELEQKICVKMI